MRIMATFATDWEFKPWLRLRPFCEVPDGQRSFRTRVAESDVRIILTGVGPLNSFRSIRAAIDEVPDICIVSGLAGGLKSKYRPGEILAAQTVRCASSGETAESEAKLFDVAVECGAKPVKQFISTGHIVRSAAGKSALSARADAVDMESFAIMKEMSSHGVPCVAVRSISDSVEMDVPCDFERALDDSGRIRIIRVFGQLVRDPGQTWQMARFGARSSRAAASLVRYLDSYTSHLAAYKEKMNFSVQPISR